MQITHFTQINSITGPLRFNPLNMRVLRFVENVLKESGRAVARVVAKGLWPGALLRSHSSKKDLIGQDGIEVRVESVAKADMKMPPITSGVFVPVVRLSYQSFPNGLPSRGSQAFTHVVRLMPAVTNRTLPSPRPTFIPPV